MIAIIDYDMGNIRSLGNSISRLGGEWTLTSDPDVITKASHVILPGVGSADKAMNNLQERNLIDLIKKLRRPVLGICVGMQVMCRSSEEGHTDCIGIFDARVKKFIPSSDIKVPNMGWSRLSNTETKLFKDLGKDPFTYFVHSYFAQLCPDTIATARHGALFSAALKYENFYGTQFHPEKSGETGEKIIRNFLEL